MITIQNEQELNDYQKFFQRMLKQNNIKSPSQLDEEGKKTFFASIKSGWKKEKNGKAKVEEGDNLIDYILNKKERKLIEGGNLVDKILDKGI